MPKMLLLTNIGTRDLASLNVPGLTLENAKEGHVVDVADPKIVDALKRHNWAREATPDDEKALAEAEKANAEAAAARATAARPIVVNPPAAPSPPAARRPGGSA